MASETQTDKVVEEAMRSLKIGSSSKASTSNLSGPKDGSSSDATSCISSGDATSSTKENMDQEALLAEQSIYYLVNGLYAYYYPGFNGSFGEWDDHGYLMGTEGLKHPANQPENSSLTYYFPGFQPGHTPHSPFLPGPMIGADGQFLGQQLYHTSPIFSHPSVSPGFVPQPVAYVPELAHAYFWDSSPLFADGLYGNGFAGDPTTQPSRHDFSSQNYTHTPAKPLISSKSNAVQKKGTSPASDLSLNPAVHSQPYKPENKAASVLSKVFLPADNFSSYSNQGKSAQLYANNPTYIKGSGCRWAGTGKLKARNKAQGLGDFDMLSEQNCGPRINSNAQISGVSSVRFMSAKADDNSNTTNAIVKKDEYNLPDFPTEYDHGLFFVIKSYSEDDIHKSIKYNVWSSTPNGNKRLDHAFQVAQEKMAEKGRKCPVFLFFSVNASGQFCGVAEMVGRVDFNKNMDFWQQDKWTGFFPVKWHIIKDIPNPQLRHIILENNDNKPVTNSRDTQEVKFPQGIEMLNVFKSYPSKTSILDDFVFYENRQKAMQVKKTKAPAAKLEHQLRGANEIAEVAKPGDLKSEALSIQCTGLAVSKTKEDLLVSGGSKE